MKEKIFFTILLLFGICISTVYANPFSKKNKKKDNKVVEYKTDSRIPKLASEYKINSKVDLIPTRKKYIAKLDYDGDGIDDRFDKCPTIPGIEKLKGCPDIDMQKMITVGHHSVILTNDEFINSVNAFSNINFKGTRMLPKSHAGLDKFVAIMKSNKKWIITISSYVDESDDNSVNMSQSKARLKTVQQYLVRKGIPMKRIKGESFGDGMPVLDLPKSRFEVEISL